MDKKILVAYSSKYGSTAEIAEKIGEVLTNAGLETEVLPVMKVPRLQPYQAVVLGSAVYFGRWQRETSVFLKFKEKDLTSMPVWLFSSGPVGEGDPVELLEGWYFPENLKELTERIKPRDIKVFHGNVNPGKMKRFDKWVLKNIKSPIGDFRDWDAIKSWAESIAEAILHESE